MDGAPPLWLVRGNTAGITKLLDLDRCEERNATDTGETCTTAVDAGRMESKCGDP